MFDKGKVSSIADGKAVVIPGTVGTAVTFPLVIPKTLDGLLKVNDDVLFAMFEDNTGIVIGLMNGESNGGESVVDTEWRLP